MLYARTNDLCKLLGLSSAIVRNLLGRYEYDRDVKQSKSPIICNRKNKEKNKSCFSQNARIKTYK